MRRLWVVLVSAIVLTIFWDSPILQPCKLLVVLVHEIWHGIVSLLSGAMLDNVAINWKESGETIVRGLHGRAGFVVSVSAGYIGTATTGALLLRRGLKDSYIRLGLGTFSAILFYMTWMFTSIGSPAFVTGFLWSLVLAAVVFVPIVSRYALISVGTICLWYTFFDLLDFTRNISKTDAGILAQYLSKNGAGLGVEDLAYSISIGWTITILLVVATVLKSAIFPYEVPAPVEAPPQDESFPGELSPEAIQWLLDRGIGPNGQPLPPELMEKPSMTEPSDGQASLPQSPQQSQHAQEPRKA